MPTPEEIASLIASWINEVCYASIEKPNVGEGTADFDIHYCPHEDVYGAFDCRVQRYYVEGMIAAARRAFGSSMFDVRFTSTIPAGSSTCHFDMFAREEDGDEWNEYSDSLRRPCPQRRRRHSPVARPLRHAPNASRKVRG